MCSRLWACPCSYDNSPVIFWGFQSLTLHNSWVKRERFSWEPSLSNLNQVHRRLHRSPMCQICYLSQGSSRNTSLVDQHYCFQCILAWDKYHVTKKMLCSYNTCSYESMTSHFSWQTYIGQVRKFAMFPENLYLVTILSLLGSPHLVRSKQRSWSGWGRSVMQ